MAEEGKPILANLPARRPMGADELTAIGEELYGRYGWQTKLARELRVDGSTVRRWKMPEGTATRVAVPDDRAAQIRALLQAHRAAQGEAQPSAGAAQNWHRRALLLIAAARTADEAMREEARGTVRADVLDLSGRVVVRLVIARDGATPEVLKVSETDAPSALADAEARLREAVTALS